MNKYLLISFLLYLNTTDYVQAQWTPKDSIWLAGILSGKDTIRLNPEFEKAIRNGTFINNDAPGQHMRMAPAAVPFNKDLSGYVQKEDTTERHKVALKDLPPSVFMKYGPRYIDEPSSFKRTREQIKREDLRGPGNTFDADAILRTLFQPSYRTQKRNAKRSATWKNYNNLPTPDVLSKRKKYIEQSADSTTKHAATDSLPNRKQ